MRDPEKAEPPKQNVVSLFQRSPPPSYSQDGCNQPDLNKPLPVLNARVSEMGSEPRSSAEFVDIGLRITLYPRETYTPKSRVLVRSDGMRMESNASI